MGGGGRGGGGGEVGRRGGVGVVIGEERGGTGGGGVGEELPIHTWKFEYQCFRCCRESEKHYCRQKLTAFVRLPSLYRRGTSAPSPLKNFQELCGNNHLF